MDERDSVAGLVSFTARGGSSAETWLSLPLQRHPRESNRVGEGRRAIEEFFGEPRSGASSGPEVLWFLGYNGRTGEGPRTLSLFRSGDGARFGCSSTCLVSHRMRLAVGSELDLGP